MQKNRGFMKELIGNIQKSEPHLTGKYLINEHEVLIGMNMTYEHEV